MYKERAGTMPSYLTSNSYYLFTYFDDAHFLLKICGIHNCTFSTNYKTLTQELPIGKREKT